MHKYKKTNKVIVTKIKQSYDRFRTIRKEYKQTNGKRDVSQSCNSNLQKLHAVTVLQIKNLLPQAYGPAGRHLCGNN